MLKIREAALSDVEALRELYLDHRNLTKNPPKEPHGIAAWSSLLEELVADPNYHLLVGELDGRVVSSVTLIVIKNLTHNLCPYAVIENVVTHCDFRNRGFAGALMEAASEIAREAGCYKIMLMTGSKLESTLRFYERCGFDINTKTAFLKKLD